MVISTLLGLASLIYEHIIEKVGLSKLTEHANVRKEVSAGKKLVEGME